MKSLRSSAGLIGADTEGDAANARRTSETLKKFNNASARSRFSTDTDIQRSNRFPAQSKCHVSRTGASPFVDSEASDPKSDCATRPDLESAGALPLRAALCWPR